MMVGEGEEDGENGGKEVEPTPRQSNLSLSHIQYVHTM
jgi:hypothetical protein